MRAEIATRLTRLNQEFYQNFADSFSSSRGAVQPGVRAMLRKYVPVGAPSVGLNLLDIGCGNGNQARELTQAGYQGSYIGIDFAPGLLAHAAAPEKREYPAPLFLSVDITQPGWHNNLPHAVFDLITCYAVMHHIPGSDTRARIYREIRTLLAPRGLFLQSNWQFLNSPRLAARVQPWAAAGFSAEDVEAGDYLLDWRGESGRTGLRYVHAADEVELTQQAAATGFEVLESLISDNGLGLYHVWQPDSTAR